MGTDRHLTQCELALFFSHAGWLVPQLADPSRRGLIVWVARHLERDERQNLAHHLRLEHPVQEEGEKALKRFLDTDPTVRRMRMNRTENLTRHVDWPTTYERALWHPPLEYYERKPAEFPDEQLVSSLLTLADSWGRLHNVLGDPKRGRGLLALRGKRHQKQRYGVAYDIRMSQRLRHLDSDAAEAIDRAVRLLDGAFGTHQDDSEVFEDLAEIIQDEQSDVLLELIVLLSIARCAGECGWDVAPHENDEQRMPQILLSRGEWRCSLSKEKPHEASSAENADRISWLRKQMGNDDSTGHEPDITLRFWREGEEENAVYVLGDAKRNVSAEGKAYIGPSVEAAVSYLAAYGHLMAVEPAGKGERDPFKCTISPAFTLFFLKGMHRVAGVKEPESVAALLGNGDDCPSVIGLDLEHLGTVESGWEPSPVLKAWFKRISTMARAYLYGSP